MAGIVAQIRRFAGGYEGGEGVLCLQAGIEQLCASYQPRAQLHVAGTDPPLMTLASTLPTCSTPAHHAGKSAMPGPAGERADDLGAARAVGHACFREEDQEQENGGPMMKGCCKGVKLQDLGLRVSGLPASGNRTRSRKYLLAIPPKPRKMVATSARSCWACPASFPSWWGSDVWVCRFTLHHNTYLRWFLTTMGFFGFFFDWPTYYMGQHLWLLEKLTCTIFVYINT